MEHQNSLELLTTLMRRKEAMLKQLGRLRDKEMPECNSVVFGSNQGTVASVSSYHDQELIDHLVRQTEAYYSKKLSTVDLLIGLAERAVQKELEPHLSDLQNILPKKSET